MYSKMDVTGSSQAETGETHGLSFAQLNVVSCQNIPWPVTG